MAVSPGSHLNRTLAPTESLRRQRRATEATSDLNTTGRTDDNGERAWNNSTFDRNSTFNKTAQSNLSRVSETSM